MRRILIDGFGNIACLMYNSIVEDKLSDTTFVGYCEDVICVVKELLMFDDVLPYDIVIEPEEIGGYDKEYYVTLDSDLNIWCCKAYDIENKRYLYDETRRLFIADDCDYTLLSKIACDEDNMYEVSYDLDKEEFKCDENVCCGCNDNNNDNDSKHEVITRVATDDTGKLRGFEKTWETHEDGFHYHSTYEFYSNNENMLKDMMENFSIKY